MRIIGIDPGTAIMGFGLVDTRGGSATAVHYGALTTHQSLPTAERLLSLYNELTEIVATFKPDAMAVEELFHNSNARTVMTVSQARGIILLVAAQAGMPIFEYTPPQVKSAVVGYGKATKEQVQTMVTTLLQLDSVPKPDDVADALAVAICHAHSARIQTLAAV